MKTLSLLLLLSLSACEPAYAMGHKKALPPEPTPIGDSPSPVASLSPSPTPSLTPPSNMRIQIGTITGASDAETQMIYSGVSIANAMLDNPCYKQWVSAAQYTEGNGLTSPQIYALQSTQINRVDVEMYYQNNRVVGFEYDPYDGVVHMNRKFVNTPSMVADNILHEDRGHGLGFHHYGAFSTSVPYGANYAYEGCSQQQMLARGKHGKIIPFKPPGIRLEIRHKKGTQRTRTSNPRRRVTRVNRATCLRTT